MDQATRPAYGPSHPVSPTDPVGPPPGEVVAADPPCAVLDDDLLEHDLVNRMPGGLTPHAPLDIDDTLPELVDRNVHDPRQVVRVDRDWIIGLRDLARDVAVEPILRLAGLLPTRKSAVARMGVTFLAGSYLVVARVAG